jgi:hypothetical protein
VSPVTSGEGLEQLVYVSESVTRVSSALQMADILAEARPRNARDGITGVLTVVDGHFVQIIEGRPEMLDRLLQGLARDSRHRMMTVLDRRAVTRRAFPEWDMVSPRLVEAEVVRLATVLDQPGGKLDAFIPMLREALMRQAEVLGGADAPVAARSPTSGQKALQRVPEADPDA